MHMRTRVRLSTGDKPGALNHRRLGRGEPLVLLHGLGMRWQWWTPCLDALAERHELVLLDLPGFGGSAPFPPERPRTPVAVRSSMPKSSASSSVSTSAAQLMATNGPFRRGLRS